MRWASPLLLLAVLAGCDDGRPEPLEYWSHPRDPQVNVYVFEQCMDRIKGPARTHYNDLDEAMEVCERVGDDAARYCPSHPVRPCLPQYIRTQEEVRKVLP